MDEDLEIILDIRRAKNILLGVLLSNIIHDERRHFVSDDDKVWLYNYLVEWRNTNPFAMESYLSGYDIIARNGVLVLRNVLYSNQPVDLWEIKVPVIDDK